MGTNPPPVSIVKQFDQSDSVEPSPVGFRLSSVRSAVKDALIVHAADIHTLDHAIVKRETDASSDVRLENGRNVVRCHG